MFKQNLKTKASQLLAFFTSSPSGRSKTRCEQYWDGAQTKQKDSHVADTLQEMANQACMLAAEVPLEHGLLTVFNVTYFNPAGMPVYIQVPQKGPKDEVIPVKLARGEEVE